MRKGTRQFITEHDLPPLLDNDKSANLGRDLSKALEKQYVVRLPWDQRVRTYSSNSSVLWKALFVAYGGPYAVAAFLKVVQDGLAFLQPQLLRWFLAYISRYQEARFQPDEIRPTKFEGFAITIAMGVAAVVQTVCLNQYFQRTFETGCALLRTFVRLG